MITVQVHDWDNFGNYRIVRDEKVTKEELLSLKKQARETAKENLNWEVIDEQNREYCKRNNTHFCHLVYCAELLDEKRKVYLVVIFMHGEAHTEDSFEKIATRSDIGHVGAFHRHLIS